MNERLKNAIPAIVCGVCIAAALILPPMFRRVEFVSAGQMSAEERVALFLGYLDADVDVQAMTLTKVDDGTASDCDEIMENLLYYFNPDSAAGWSGSTGSEYLHLSGEAGEMTVCRMWLETTGDWHSWTDAFFNADTGELYYIYSSGTCLYHRGDYTVAFEGGLNPERCAELAADYGRESLKLFSLDENGRASAIFTRNGDLICREIECTYYTSTFYELELRVK